MNEEKICYLMHKDDIVTAVFMDEATGFISKVVSKGDLDLLPLGGRLSPEDLKRWWKRRAVPVSQGNMERILLNSGIATTQDYLVKNMGLSLSDHYWIKPVNSEFSWKDVSLFSNSFKDLVGDLQFKDSIEEIDLINQTEFCPSASLQGELRKKWVIDKGIRYLIKGNYGESYQQSINEVIATLIHEKQSLFSYTKYKLCKIDTTNGEGIGCICENFADETMEFIPAYDVVCSIKKRNEVSEYEHFIRICAENGLNGEFVRGFLEYQILTDFVMTNTDRHFNNFGVLRNSKTLKFISLAPIFDSGNSMFWNQPNFPLNNDLLNIPISSFKKKEIELLRYVTDVHRVNIGRLPNREEIKKWLEKDIDAEKRIPGILKGYEKKTALLKQLQQGEKIWHYS